MSETPVFIVGGSSFIGKHLLNELKKNGDYNLKVMTRSLTKKTEILRTASRIKIVEGDLLKPESLNGLIEPYSIVINLAYNRKANADVNIKLTNNLIDACKKIKIKRLIHISTADVVGRNSNNIIEESCPCQPITEYAITKQKLEKLVLVESNNEFDTVVLRPTAIFGAGGYNLIKLANDVVSGSRIKNYFRRCLFGYRRMNLVSIENVILSIIYLMHHSKNFSGEIFNISDDESPYNNYINIEEILMQQLKASSSMLPYITLPSFMLSFFLKYLGRDNINPSRIYSAKKIKDMGFNKNMNFERAVNNFAEWYRSIYMENNL